MTMTEYSKYGYFRQKISNVPKNVPGNTNIFFQTYSQKIYWSATIFLPLLEGFPGHNNDRMKNGVFCWKMSNVPKNVPVGSSEFFLNFWPFQSISHLNISLEPTLDHQKVICNKFLIAGNMTTKKLFCVVSFTHRRALDFV